MLTSRSITSYEVESRRQPQSHSRASSIAVVERRRLIDREVKEREGRQPYVGTVLHPWGRSVSSSTHRSGHGLCGPRCLVRLIDHHLGSVVHFSWSAVTALALGR
ncbi:hypothetical protein E2562_002242 [Oryza meyeriana var. granulata]|uniref:Uncharacterized protein n=1 Tax=Oryza meyeriana var. granulata TaxID=110450 RepID=A0A6G1BJC4_9ORYZ|nr:hypothetical protein E2562_002242 [Oryza meyeriana var. granulata]